MAEKKRIAQSFTAYQCRISQKHHIENLLVSNEDTKASVDLFELLKEYFQFIKTSKLDVYTNRTILLESDVECGTLGGSVERLVIHPKAGKANENFTVVDHTTNRLMMFEGKNNSAIYGHNVFCYQKGEENVLVFHRHGQSGCKTAFYNTFNDFLRARGLVCHLEVMISNGMFEGYEEFVPEKLSLLTTYSDVSSDIADNIKKKKRKKVEQEVIISLNAPRAGNVVEFLQEITKKKPSIEELKTVLIKNEYTDQFDDAKLTMKFGQVRRKISLSEFSGLIAEYDITNKLKYFEDGTIQKESLYSLADQYALSFFEEREE